jgi:hypothetical protein
MRVSLLITDTLITDYYPQQVQSIFPTKYYPPESPAGGAAGGCSTAALN